MRDTIEAPSAVERAVPLAELNAAVPHIRAAPKDGGRLDLIISRPGHGERTVLERTRISLAEGVDGDHWAQGCHLEDENGDPHPDVQICIMPSRVIGAIAGDIAYWPAAGDNLFIDMDLTPENFGPGTRFALGSAALVVTAEPHNGCKHFVARYGRDAVLFVNTGLGKELRFRGIYARVTRDGDVAVGDRVRRL